MDQSLQLMFETADTGEDRTPACGLCMLYILYTSVLQYLAELNSIHCVCEGRQRADLEASVKNQQSSQQTTTFPQTDPERKTTDVKTQGRLFLNHRSLSNQRRVSAFGGFIFQIVNFM